VGSDIVKRALYGTPKVGGDTLSYCTRCKMELAHVIVAMIDTKPAKVLCKTCRTQHNYRRTSESTGRTSASARSPRPTAKKSTSVIRVAELWEKRLSQKQEGEAKPYTVQKIFVLGDLLQHPKFGMGIVEEVKMNGKITVLFRDGERILVHSLGAGNAAQ
jgi:hypothetical protein